jgi:hypothetical protein
MKPTGAPSSILRIAFVIAPVIVIALGGSASPLSAQSHVYTNADLGKPLTTDRPVVTAEELSALAARQFQPIPQYDGPYVVMASADPGVQPPGRPQQAYPYPNPYLVDTGWQDPALLAVAPFGFVRGRPAPFALRHTLPASRPFGFATRATSRARASRARR